MGRCTVPERSGGDTGLRSSGGRLRTSETRGYEPASLVVMTIGHSTRSLEELIHLLKSNGVKRVVDVRSIPRSRHNPQFNRATLSPALHSVRLHYKYMPGLGGFRHPHPDSLNTAWRNASFRGFADDMQTPGFEASLMDLIELARQERTAIMCAEAVPWRCHRSLIADALLARGIAVCEITGIDRTKLYTLTPWAQLSGTHVTYPGERNNGVGIIGSLHEGHPAKNRQIHLPDEQIL
jgi:hypothetical protein